MSYHNTEVKQLIQRLQEQMNRTLALYEGITAGELGLPDEHGCAVGQTFGGLLSHNIEHDRMHGGQVATKRWELGVMQSDPAQRLIAEW